MTTSRDELLDRLTEGLAPDEAAWVRSQAEAYDGAVAEMAKSRADAAAFADSVARAACRGLTADLRAATGRDDIEVVYGE